MSTMSEEWDSQIELWKKLRDQADQRIKQTLNMEYPRECGHPKLENVPNQSTIGRALLAFTRCDLTIKTIQMYKIKK